MTLEILQCNSDVIPLSWPPLHQRRMGTKAKLMCKILNNLVHILKDNLIPSPIINSRS